jgi:hypothetical protein
MNQAPDPDAGALVRQQSPRSIHGDRDLNEWGFAAEIKSWWDQELKQHPEWKLFYTRVEETVPGSKKRSDLVRAGQGGISRASCCCFSVYGIRK